MMLRDVRRAVLALGVFLVPTVLVKSAALVAGQGGPQAAAARSGDGSSEDIVVPKPFVAEWPPEQLAAAHYIAVLRGQPFGPSPLLHQVTAKTVIGTEPVKTGPQPVPPPNVTVQAILSAEGGNIALINRKRYREGDPLEAAGWFVKAIDHKSRSVTVVHPETSAEATYAVPLPLR
jgi:hypothetical protein